MKSISFILFVIFFVSSCSEELVNPPSFESGFFPIKEGNWWRYQVIDSTENTIDTIKVYYITKSQLTGIKLYIGYVDNNNKITDSFEVAFSAFLVSYREMSYGKYSYFAHFIIKFPFKVGDSWKDGPDNYSVNKYTSNELILDSNYHFFSIKRKGESNMANEHYYVDYSIQVAKDIGIVRNYVIYRDEGRIMHKQIYNLINYQIW